MKYRNRALRRSYGLLLIAALVLGLLNTRFGVFIVFDLFDEDVDSPQDPIVAPIQHTEYRAASPAFSLPLQIEQPSGIAYLESSDTFAIVTDQAELFLVSNDFSTIQLKSELGSGLLVQRQGSIEGVDALDGQRLAVAGENSSVVDILTSNSGTEFHRGVGLQLTGLEDELEFSSIAYNRVAREYYLASDERFSITVVDETGQRIREIALVADVRSGRDLNEFQISGLEYSGGYLFAVTENYNSILVIDPAGDIIRSIGVENGGQISGIAVRQNRAYLTLDHNYFDDRPPVLSVDLG